MYLFRIGDGTDGIIFQPNLPYVCGTDVHLLKWKYLDTVTIDVQIMPPPMHHYNHSNFDEDTLHVAVTGEEGSMVDMTCFICLPSSERRKFEADCDETGAKIAEVGFEPTTGEWYYGVCGTQSTEFSGFVHKGTENYTKLNKNPKEH